MNSIWRVAIALFLALCITPSVSAQQPSAEQAGVLWFDRMATALRELNFEATLVQVQGDRIQPIMWLHGRHSDNLEVELLIHLNGADVRILRLGDQTSYYFQPADNSYSINSDSTYGLLPAAFYRPFTHLNDYYQVIAGRGMRVTGRDTQYLRLVSRDNSRYHYSLWVDRESGMLLKLQMLTPQGQVLEQLQLTSFQLSDELPVSLEDLQGVQRPPRLFDPNTAEAPQFSLLPRWLPSGFTLQRQTHRLLYATQLANDHFLYSDGLTEVSVYISRKRDQALPELAFEGAESFYNTSKGDYAITVVGKLPLATLRKIAENVDASGPRQ
jgi:sigma-E factor negative regulatory protein RseB